MAVKELHPAKGVTGALEEEQRNRDIGEVGHSQPVLLPGRVERIRIQDRSRGRIALRHEIRGHPPPHRSTGQEQMIDPLSQVIGCGSVHLDESLGSVRAFRAPLGVGVVEGHDRVACLG